MRFGFENAGKVDDLWSVYYVAIENANGQLPWRYINDRPTVANIKRGVLNSAVVTGQVSERQQFTLDRMLKGTSSVVRHRPAAGIDSRDAANAGSVLAALDTTLWTSSAKHRRNPE